GGEADGGGGQRCGGHPGGHRRGIRHRRRSRRDRRRGTAGRYRHPPAGYAAPGPGGCLPRAHQGKGGDQVTLLGSPALGQAPRTGAGLVRQARAEIMKIRTTNTWWLFLTGVVVLTALGARTNGVRQRHVLHPQPSPMRAAEEAQAIAQAAQARTRAGVAAIATSRMTSGQFSGVLFAMLIAVLAVTNEFAHQTATATFL